MRYRERRAKPAVDWSSIDYIVGTRTDVTGTGIHRPCQRCAHDVFTSRTYPTQVPMVCEYCALEMVREEEAAGRNVTGRVSPSGAAFDSLIDPWQRSAKLLPREPTPPIKRRRRLGPSPESSAPEN